MKINTNLIHCNSCEYEGVGKSDSSVMFMALMALFATSVIFLPMIIVALIYLGWMLTKPVKYKCPKCKSSDIKVQTSIQQTSTEEKTENSESSKNQEQTN